MSMGIMKNGAYQKCAGMTQSGELVMGASTIRTGRVATPAIAAGSSASVTVTFDEPMPDANYCVFLESNNNPLGGLWFVDEGTRTANGFQLFSGTPLDTAASAGYITYTAFKLFTVEGLEDLENDVADLKEFESKVGTYLDNSVGQTPLTAGTDTILTSVSLPKGTWVVVGNLIWGTGVDGTSISCSITTGSVIFDPAAAQSTKGMYPSGLSNVSRILVLNAATTVNLTAWAAGGSSVTVDAARIFAVRIA